MGKLSSAPARAAGHRVHWTGVQRIRSLQMVGGFLDGAALEFADELTCVIGARGAGKTTMLELIRFTLDALPSAASDPAARRRVESLVQENLRGGRVELTVETRDGMTYLITRAWGEDPIVLTEDGRATQITLRSGALFQADIYSQNEVEAIADRSASQLTLLDAFEREAIAAINVQLDQLLHDLAANASAMLPLQGKINLLSEELAALPTLVEKISSFAAIGGSSAEAINGAHALKALRDREKRALEGIGQFLGEYDAQLEGQEGLVGSKIAALFCRDVGTGPNEALVGQIQRSLSDCASDVDAALSTARRRIAQVVDGLGDVAGELQVRHNDQEMQFRTLVEQHRSAQGQVAERSKLERARNDLLAKQRVREELVGQLESLQRKRTAMLRHLSELRDQRFALRQAVAEMICHELKDVVRASVTQAGDPSAYQALLAEALKNARVKPHLVAPKLVGAFWPSRLVEIVRGGNTQQLVSEADLNEDQARKVLEALAGSPVLFDLEVVDLADLPRIELNDQGEYKPTESLSKGQKCTAVLPILLLDSERPLLIDQPEDNLDNGFVFECVVSSIRRVKARRQLIFVTHNANIPVLGDAERVLVLHSDGTKSQLSRSGTVDDCKDEIVRLLEGGERAFRQRVSRYALA